MVLEITILFSRDPEDGVMDVKINERIFSDVSKLILKNVDIYKFIATLKYGKRKTVRIVTDIGQYDIYKVDEGGEDVIIIESKSEGRGAKFRFMGEYETPEYSEGWEGYAGDLIEITPSGERVIASDINKIEFYNVTLSGEIVAFYYAMNIVTPNDVIVLDVGHPADIKVIVADKSRIIRM